jgi:hypothetical protein
MQVVVAQVHSLNTFVLELETKLLECEVITRHIFTWQNLPMLFQSHIIHPT